MSTRPRLVVTDGGKSESQHPYEQNDCMVRAMAIATNLPYDYVYQAFEAAGREANGGVGRDVLDRVFRLFPKHKFSIPERPDSYPWRSYDIRNLGDFVRVFPRGRFIVTTTAVFARCDPGDGWAPVKTPPHAFAVIDGAMYDECRIARNRLIASTWQVTDP